MGLPPTRGLDARRVSSQSLDETPSEQVLEGIPEHSPPWLGLGEFGLVDDLELDVSRLRRRWRYGSERTYCLCQYSQGRHRFGTGGLDSHPTALVGVHGAIGVYLVRGTTPTERVSRSKVGLPTVDTVIVTDGWFALTREGSSGG